MIFFSNAKKRTNSEGALHYETNNSFVDDGDESVTSSTHWNNVMQVLMKIIVSVHLQNQR